MCQMSVYPFNQAVSSQGLYPIGCSPFHNVIAAPLFLPWVGGVISFDGYYMPFGQDGVDVWLDYWDQYRKPS
jgi:hypothetical protein